MAEETRLKIDIFRKKSLEEFTAALADPGSRLACGSAAASVGAVSSALLCRAARRMQAAGVEGLDLDWYLRNTEILRTYLLNLVDEDVKCHNPLRRALKEGDERKIEASRQAAVSICLEIVNMMGKSLELTEGLLSCADTVSAADLAESAELAYAASLAAGDYVLTMSRLSQDDTYRYVMQRENELTVQQQKECLERILTDANKNS